MFELHVGACIAAGPDYHKVTLTLALCIFSWSAIWFGPVN